MILLHYTIQKKGHLNLNKFLLVNNDVLHNVLFKFRQPSINIFQPYQIIVDLNINYLIFNKLYKDLQNLIHSIYILYLATYANNLLLFINWIFIFQ